MVGLSSMALGASSSLGDLDLGGLRDLDLRDLVAGVLDLDFDLDLLLDRFLLFLALGFDGSLGE